MIACELLACEIPQLIDAMIDRDVLAKLWNFLQRPHSTEPSFALQAVYFSKIITIFFTKKTIEMLNFMKSTPDNLKMLLFHLQNSSIMDLLLTLIRLDELPEAKGIVQVLCECV